MNPIAGFKEKIAATGITWHSGYYWSSTPTAWPDAWGVILSANNVEANFYEFPTDNEFDVLGCLAF